MDPQPSGVELAAEFQMTAVQSVQNRNCGVPTASAKTLAVGIK
jgi:hypothetical protein